MDMKLFFLFIQLVYLPCKVLGASRRVVNGDVIEPDQWPFLVSLHYMKPHKFTANTHMHHLCGGSLIDPYWVLTAAHCFSDVIGEGLEDVTQWQVVLGEHNQFVKDDGEQTIGIEKAVLHPDYNFGIESPILVHDLALLRLKTPANLTEFVDVIDLNTGGDLDGTECEVGGWGQLAQDPYGWGMYIPLKTNNKIVNTDDCAKIYEDVPFFQFDESTVCASDQASGEIPEGHAGSSCYGDSGGPLICKTGGILAKKTRLSGVVSGGYACGDASYPGIYANVSNYVDWIVDTMSSYQPTPLCLK